MAKAKEARLTPTQINEWVTAQRKLFATVCEQVCEDSDKDCALYNGEQVDLWLKHNLHPNTYAQDKVREYLAKMLLDQDATALKEVFNIDQKSAQTNWSTSGVAVKAFAEDLKLALIMNPTGDYKATTQGIVDLHTLKLKSLLGV